MLLVATSHPYRTDDIPDEREWVRAIWNEWFDAVFPPTPAESEWGDDESEDYTQAAEEPVERYARYASH